MTKRTVGVTAEEFYNKANELGSQNKAVEYFCDEGRPLARSTGQKLFKDHKQFLAYERPEFVSAEVPIDELVARRKKDFSRLVKAKEAEAETVIKMKTNDPIGLTFVGDPHLDDDGCNVAQLEKDFDTIGETPGMFGVNTGDNQNLWIGRLSVLYGDQQTTIRQGWQLVEHFLNKVSWLALVKGNHDLWVGKGDPLDWIMRDTGAVIGKYDVKLRLEFPNGTSTRIWLRHNFQGNSQWNTLHGLMKKALMGYPYDIFVCGDHHVSAHHTEYNEQTDGVWHAIRSAGYKEIDDYPEALGLKKNNAVKSYTALIDPSKPNSSESRIRMIGDVQEASELLTYFRNKKEAA